MRVLVLGGTEFISHHLVRSLVRDGHEVAVLNRGRRPERLPGGVRTIVADRKDHAALRTALAGERVDALVDVTYAPTTGEDVDATLDALAGRAGHVLFVSTGRVYDHARPIPYDEDAVRSLYWGDYAKHKIAGEEALFRRHREHGLPVTVVRPTHVYGPMNTRNNETFFFDRLVRGRPVLVPGAGGWLRQFGHVEDLVEAMAAMLGRRAAFGRAYNVTGEEVITQVGFAELVADVVKRPLSLVHCPDSSGPKAPPFGQNLVYDCHAVYTTSRLRVELGLRPRYTLAAGIAQTFEWYLAQGLARREVDFSADDRFLAGRA
ncbi:MAG: NAD-dependent epimerase/dehydratase family protein [Candidatus Rokubacteria bacterium]|nr:NAD-dependent epimerase/dehydratase family protein [Candidatus Rokubacteria bacterium]